MSESEKVHPDLPFERLNLLDVKTEIIKNKEVYLVKFPWKNDYVDPETACQFCLTYEESICEDDFNIFKESLVNKKSKKEQDELFEKLNNCSLKNAHEFLPRMELIKRVFEVEPKNLNRLVKENRL